MVLIWSSFYTKVLSLPIFCYHLLVVDRHKLTVFYLKSFDMDSVQVYTMLDASTFFLSMPMPKVVLFSNLILS